MSTPNHKNNKQPHINDDCTDCKKEKIQNQALIKCYEKLQSIEKQSSRIRKSVDQHKSISTTNRSFYKSFETKLDNLPKMKENRKDQVFQKMGFQLAVSMLEKDIENPLRKQNQRLKSIILQKNKSFHRRQPKKHIKDQQQNKKKNYSLNKSIQIESNNDKQEKESQFYISRQQSSISSDKISEINFSTQSTNFQLKEMRKTNVIDGYKDMNLWLYQNEKNSMLQEELYLINNVRPRRKISKKTEKRLPQIVSKK